MFRQPYSPSLKHSRFARKRRVGSGSPVPPQVEKASADADAAAVVAEAEADAVASKASLRRLLPPR
jgi:hypothetical protein